MATQAQKIIRSKLGVLELAKHLGKSPKPAK